MTEIFHYPDDLEALVAAQWPADVEVDALAQVRRAVLEVAYHASMTREEARPVRIRILLARAADLDHAPAFDGPLPLRLDRSRPFEVDELRRIALAAPFETALVAVEPDATGELRIWGVVSTGAQWLAPSWGGRERPELAFPFSVVHVRGPARIAVHAGERFVAGLEGGRLVTLRTDVFASRWMPRLFAGMHAEVAPQHPHEASHGEGVALDESLVRAISQQMVRRALYLMREAHHGGTILFVEPDDAEHLFASLLRAKYRFGEGPARTRYRALLRVLTRELERRSGGGAALTEADFHARASDLADVEAAIFELSRTVASLSAVDGAVVLSKRFEILAFGVEVAVARRDDDRHASTRVHRALDAEGDHTVDDDEENVGTRHRAAYRFVQAHPRGLAIVVSQDGTIRFVASHEGRVTYHEQHVAG